LHSQIAQSRASDRTQVWAATYVEPETGIAHQTAVKKFKASPSNEELHEIHKELAVTFMASSRCHNVCKVFGWCHDEADGALCVVMKRYEENLSSKMMRMPEGRLPLSTVQKYSRQVCTAVAELHAQNIVVADIKPHNLLIDEYDNCVVADFGISTILSSASEHKQCDGMHGTFNYMSPEAFDPQTFGGVTTHTDAWSFACCVIEMVTGRRPWDNVAMSAICYKVSTALEVPAVPHVLPTHVRELLLRCFSHSPTSRPSFGQLVAAFQEDWVEAPKTDMLQQQHQQQQHAEGGAHEAAQLRSRVRALEAEKSEWEKERAEMRCAHQADQSRLEAELRSARDEAQRAGSVTVQLRDQLRAVMESLKGGERCHNCVQSELLRSQLEHQLVQCNEGLAQCIKQKDVAKEMLRRESENSRGLSVQIQQMRALSKFVGWSLQAVIKEAADAKKEAREVAVAERQREWASDAERRQTRPVRATPIKVPQLSTSAASLLDTDTASVSTRDTAVAGGAASEWPGAGVSSSSVDSMSTASSSLGSARSLGSSLHSQASTPLFTDVKIPPSSVPAPLPAAPLCRWEPQEAAHC